MNMFFRSAATAILIAATIQSFTVGVLAPKLPKEVCRPEVQEVRTLTLPMARRLIIENTDGAVTVNTHERDVDAVDVTADIRAYTQSSETKIVAEHYLKKVVEVLSQGETVRVVSEPGERPPQVDLRVNYTVAVPEGTDIEVSVTNGNVWIGPNCGQVSVSGNISDVDVMNPQGAVDARSNIGRIGVVGSRESTRLKTVNGNIVVTQSGGTLQASTTNGHVYTTLAAAGVSACDLTVMNGNITLVMSEDSSAKIDASTQRGTVESTEPLTEMQGEARERELHGVIGAGQTVLTMQSLNGNIWISRSTT